MARHRRRGRRARRRWLNSPPCGQQDWLLGPAQEWQEDRDQETILTAVDFISSPYSWTADQPEHNAGTCRGGYHEPEGPHQRSRGDDRQAVCRGYDHWRQSPFLDLALALCLVGPIGRGRAGRNLRSAGCSPTTLCRTSSAIEPPMQNGRQLWHYGRLPRCCCKAGMPARIALLPACPKTWAKKVLFSGLRARGGYKVNCTWEDGRVTSLQDHRRQSGRTRLRRSRSARPVNGEVREVFAGVRCRNHTLFSIETGGIEVD